MKKSNRWIVLFALGLPMIAAVSPKADFVLMLQEKLKAFYENKNRVNIHLILNQPEYLAGDTAFFKAHLIQGQNLKPASGKRILNLELIGKKQERLIRNRIACRDGLGIGQLILPDDLEPGNYVLIAYCDDMEPNAPTLVSQTELWIGGDKTFIKKENDIELFPEGGTLVTGIRTKIIARIPGNTGAARVTDSSGKVITELTTHTSGLGSFFITPEPGERYSVETASGKKELMEAKPDGAGIQIEHNTAEQSFRVTLQVPKASSFRAGELYLVLTSHGTTCFSRSITFEKENAITLSVPWSDCTEGVGQLTLFTANAEVLAERLVFIEPKPVDLNVSMDADHYLVRKPAKIDIRLRDFRGVPAVANLSVTVYKEDLFSNAVRIPGFQESVLLQNDLAPGSVSFPDLTTTSGADVSDYLITQRWGSFRWDEVLAERKEKPSQFPSSPFYFKGTVLFTHTGKPVPDSTAVTFYLNRNDFVYLLYTRKNGELEFPLFMDFSSDQLFYSIYYKGKQLKDASLFLQGSPPVPGPLLSAVAGTNSDPYTAFSKSRRPILKSFNYYLSKSANREANGAAEASEYAEFDDVDVVADIDKFKKFGSMAEVLLEVVPAVRHRKAGNQDAVRVFLQESAMFAQEDPLFFIDGVITDSAGYFLSLDPDHVSRIKVLRSERTLHPFGDLGKNGMVIVERKAPDKDKPVPRSKRILNITGVTPPIPFVTPNYSGAVASNVPDLRANLYWQPQISTDKEGKASVSFFTGDATGTFLVRIEGVTATGQPFSKSTRFSVSLD